jgi:UDP-N-acetylenolpyruvoylglucosamine reductase
MSFSSQHSTAQQCTIRERKEETDKDEEKTRTEGSVFQLPTYNPINISFHIFVLL